MRTVVPLWPLHIMTLHMLGQGAIEYKTLPQTLHFFIPLSWPLTWCLNLPFVVKTWLQSSTIHFYSIVPPGRTCDFSWAFIRSYFVNFSPHCAHLNCQPLGLNLGMPCVIAFSILILPLLALGNISATMTWYYSFHQLTFHHYNFCYQDISVIQYLCYQV